MQIAKDKIEMRLRYIDYKDSQRKSEFKVIRRYFPNYHKTSEPIIKYTNIYKAILLLDF